MQEYSYERPLVSAILNGPGRKKRFLHIITGPRQVGNTTAALQIAAKWKGPVLREIRVLLPEAGATQGRCPAITVIERASRAIA